MPSKDEKRAELLAALPHFTGTERWFRHAMNQRVTYTEGAQFVAEKAGAYWLLDEIAIVNKYERKVQREEFQVWKLTVKDSVGLLVCEDGNNNVVNRRRIPFTDFPLDKFELWFENNVIMLPSER
jgi:hypothetical protein